MRHKKNTKLHSLLIIFKIKQKIAALGHLFSAPFCFFLFMARKGNEVVKRDKQIRCPTIIKFLYRGVTVRNKNFIFNKIFINGQKSKFCGIKKIYNRVINFLRKKKKFINSYFVTIYNFFLTVTCEAAQI